MTKGPPILNVQERAEIIRHCKFVDEVQIDVPYTPNIETLKSYNCDFYAHGDDPCIDSFGVDVTAAFREAGMYKEFKRTEGVSTTGTTGKLIALADYDANKEEQSANNSIENPPLQQFLATSRRITNFANVNMPKPNDTVVYIQGSFDLLHHGHLKRLQEAKKLGDFLYVGIWDDQMVKYYKGE